MPHVQWQVVRMACDVVAVIVPRFVDEVGMVVLCTMKGWQPWPWW